jgi:hypothetical protein
MLENFEADYAAALSQRANRPMREHGIPVTPVISRQRASDDGCLVSALGQNRKSQ